MNNFYENNRFPGKPNAWLANSEFSPYSKVRLFCFPYSGAGSSVFRPWMQKFPHEIEVCPVILPGRESRWSEKPFSNLSDLVESTAEALNPFFTRPFAFFGHSMGALLSFELARYLRRTTGCQPEHMFVSAHPAPQFERREPPTHALSDEEFIEKLYQLKGMDESIMNCPELRELLLPTLRADFALCETYHFTPDAPLDCPISAFGGLDDEFVGRNDLAGWNVQSRNHFKLRMFPGNHFFLKQNTCSLIEVISRELYSHSLDSGHVLGLPLSYQDLTNRNVTK